MRKCKYCNSGQIDDEMHFLLKCNFHSANRLKLFNNIHKSVNTKCETTLLFTNILANNSEGVLSALGKFLYDSFQDRKKQEKLG